MPALLLFIVFFMLVLVGGAMLAYPTYMLLISWFEWDFERVVSRCVLGIAIVIFLVLFKKLGFASWREIGFNTDQKEFWKSLLNGFAAGILIMLPVIAGLLISKNRVIDYDWVWSFGDVSLLLMTAIITGLLVALIEETLFRGAMLSAIQRQGSILFAVVSTSLFYAFVHFLQPETLHDPNTLGWLSGLTVLKNAFLPLLQPMYIVDSFIALFLAGTLLAIIKIYTNKLAICIGIHAGWVFTIKTLKQVTDTNVYSEYAFLSGDYDNVIGYLAAICIAFTIVIYIGMKNRSPAN